MTLTLPSLPDRPLRLAPGTVSGPRLFLFALAIFLLIGGAIAWWQTPGLIRDWQISRNPVVLYDGDIRNGKCTTRKGIFTDCEAHLAYDYNGRHYESDVTLMFVDLHSGDYEVDLVISGDKPELATMSLGLEKLWNRLTVFALFTLLFFGMAAMLVRQKLRAARASAALARPGRLTLVPAEITQVQEARGNSFVTYRPAEGAKTVLLARFAKGEEPLVVQDATGQTFGLAARGETTPMPALLDSGLRRVDLTEAERSAILDALPAAQAAADLPQDKPKPRLLRAILGIVAVIVLVIAAVLGWWLWHVTNGSDPFEPLGMEINAMLPAAMNEWGCDQLQARFGDQRAPYGCVAADWVSWK